MSAFRGSLMTEIEYLYDLPLPPRSSPEYVMPRPHDDEVESFEVRLRVGNVG